MHKHFGRKPRDGSNSQIRLSPSCVKVAGREGAVVLHKNSGQYFSLNLTSAVILEALMTGATICELVDRILDRFDIDRGTAEREVRSVVAEFSRLGLVEVSS